MANKNYRILDERDLNELKEEDKNLKKGVLKNEKSINDIKEDVSGLQGNVSNISESIREIKTDVTNIEGDVVNIENKVDTIENRIDNINDEVDIVVSVGKVEASSIESDVKPTVIIKPSEDGPKGELDFIFEIPKGNQGIEGDTIGITSVDLISASDGVMIQGRPGVEYTYRMNFSDNTYDDFTFGTKNGSDGDDGKSAYEIAGGDDKWGSEEAWLESLKATPLPMFNVDFGMDRTYTTISTEDDLSDLTKASSLFFPIRLTELTGYNFISASIELTQIIPVNLTTKMLIYPFSCPIPNFLEKQNDGSYTLKDGFLETIAIWRETTLDGTPVAQVLPCKITTDVINNGLIFYVPRACNFTYGVKDKEFADGFDSCVYKITEKGQESFITDGGRGVYNKVMGDYPTHLTKTNCYIRILLNPQVS